MPGIGGFLLTDGPPELRTYYRPGHELGLFDGKEELIRKVRFYLEHEDTRRAIVEAGYRRTLAEHTFEHRFNEIFAAMGLPQRAPSLESAS